MISSESDENRPVNYEKVHEASNETTVVVFAGISATPVTQLPCSWTTEVELVKQAKSNNAKGIMTLENSCQDILGCGISSGVPITKKQPIRSSDPIILFFFQPIQSTDPINRS